MSDQCISGDSKLDAAVNVWLRHDKNPETLKEVRDDISHSRWDKLRSTMLGRQKFGTAGLRGKMAAGYKCMNDVVVLQTAQGLCSYMKKVCNQKQLGNGIVVGFDGRYNSKRFAHLTAKVFVSSDIPVHLFSEVCPTPLVSFATILYEAAGGVMVTASHNPKEDNGYKVYWGNGSQIITPHDDNILDEIRQNLDIPESYWDVRNITDHPLVTDCLRDVTDQYMSYVRGSVDNEALTTNKAAGISVVYSAMHGVGHKFIVKAFEACNLKAPISVPEQQEPDPEFRTVRFPNPEEPECIALSRACAERTNSRLVLVNDPDGDRLAVAEREPSTGKWKVFTGNEMGALLGWWLLTRMRAGQGAGSEGKGAGPEGQGAGLEEQDVFFIASIVSSKMLRSIAAAEGCHFVETLTGFKWMGNTTLILAKEGKLPLFAFEEAIGYMCSARVPDKDGVSAAVHVASLASWLYNQGSSLSAQLEDLYSRYGRHATHNAYFPCHEQRVAQRIFSRIRNYHGPGEYPRQVAGCAVVAVQDLAAGVRIPEDRGDHHHLRALGTGLDQEYKSGEMMILRCSNGLSVMVRTSGTEPKIKYYTELVTRDGDNNVDLEKMVQKFIDELLQPKENGLIK